MASARIRTPFTEGDALLDSGMTRAHLFSLSF